MARASHPANGRDTARGARDKGVHGAATADQGEAWGLGPFRCASPMTGLRCIRGKHAFTLSRKTVRAPSGVR